MLGRKTAKIKCHSHPPCPGYMLSTSPMMLTLTTSAAVFALFVRFFSHPCPPFQTVPFGEKSL